MNASRQVASTRKRHDQNPANHRPKLSRMLPFDEESMSKVYTEKVSAVFADYAIYVSAKLALAKFRVAEICV